MMASRIVLREFTVSETCAPDDPGAVRVDLPDGSGYFIRQKLLQTEKLRPDGKPSWTPRNFTVYPIVVKGDGTPWDEANVWILSSLEHQHTFTMSTYRTKAEDLQHFQNFIDTREFDYLVFPDAKQSRPTYRYRGFLNVAVQADGMARTTAARRMSNVINFYRFLINNKLFAPENPPWIEADAFMPVVNSVGVSSIIKTKTTDVGINNVTSDNPYADTIADGEKLRPLPRKEQAWIIEALSHLRNTEQTLIQVLALTTGARIQTVLTIRKRHIMQQYRDADVQLQCGPGTGIDTKGNKLLTIQIPRWLMNCLRTYVMSARAVNRRIKALGGDIDDQYLFLSERSAPMYEAKERQNQSGERKIRHVKNGQAVRAYMKDYIIKYIQDKHDPQFSYRFHDLRASFGMNLVDDLKLKMDAGEMTYTQVLAYVQARMSHSSPVTTDRYLRYRENRALFENAQDQFEIKIEAMIEKVMVAS